MKVEADISIIINSWYCPLISPQKMAAHQRNWKTRGTNQYSERCSESKFTFHYQRSSWMLYIISTMNYYLRVMKDIVLKHTWVYKKNNIDIRELSYFWIERFFKESCHSFRTYRYLFSIEFIILFWEHKKSLKMSAIILRKRIAKRFLKSKKTKRICLGI